MLALTSFRLFVSDSSLKRRHLCLLLEAVDDLFDLGVDLAPQAREVGVELAHAGMARKQRRRKLGDLPLDAHALLDEVLNERRFLHVGQRVGGALLQHLARRLGACLRLAARRLDLGELGRELAELLLVETRRLLPAHEDVGAAAKPVGLRLRGGDLVGELGDLRLEGLLRLVGFDDGLRRERLAIGLGEPVGDLGGKLGIDRCDADVDRAALLGRKDLDPVEEGGEHPVVLALAGAGRADADEAQDRGERVDGAERRVEFGPIPELEIVGDLHGEVGREERPHVRVDRLLVHADRDGLRPGGRIGERVRAALACNGELGLRHVARRHQAEDEEGQRSGQCADEGEPRELSAHGGTERLQVDVVGLGLVGRTHGQGLELEGSP